MRGCRAELRRHERHEITVSVRYASAAVMAALFPVADLILHILPGPSQGNYLLIVKLPAVLISIVLLVLLQHRRTLQKFAIESTVVGLLLLFVYLFTCSLVLFAGPQHRRGENSIIGTRMTPFGEMASAENGWTSDTLHRQFRPDEWKLLYDDDSQRRRVFVLSALYVACWSMLTYGLFTFGRRNHKCESRKCCNFSAGDLVE